MKILALEPFYGGSHKAFLDAWQRNSRHEFTVLGLPPNKWKWRMRHSAQSFAQQLQQPEFQSVTWDVLWCSDMLNLAEFRGLSGEPIRQLPGIVYFHENQLTYPVRFQHERDLHFAYTNFTTALAADRVWFNSAFHRDEFLEALRDYLLRMPDHHASEEVDRIAHNSDVHYPGIEPTLAADNSQRTPGPMRICWNARWEHDKNPEEFFAALRILVEKSIDFRLIVLGESFANSPAVFATAQRDFADRIEHWGYAETPSDYQRWLASADVVVSTAHHEFFGIGVVEAIATGAIPVLPNRLAYPEVMSRLCKDGSHEKFLYNGRGDDAVDRLAERLVWLAGDVGTARWRQHQQSLQAATSCFHWPHQASAMDDAIQTLCRD